MQELPNPMFAISQLGARPAFWRAPPSTRLPAPPTAVPEPVPAKAAGQGITVSWARHQDDVRAAQRLRYEVFAGEMGARLPANGSRIDTFADLQTYIALRPGEPMEFRVQRGNAEIQLHAAPRPFTDSDQFGNQARIGRLGISPSTRMEFTRLPFYQLPGAAIGKTVDSVQTMITALGQVITGRRSIKELGGPLKIAEVSGQQASLGWLPFFWLMTVVSINLGFINLLPIPLLDGGHLLFYAIEGVRRKPLKPQAQEWAFRTGLALLLGLMIFVTFNDLASFGLFERLGGLIG